MGEKSGVNDSGPQKNFYAPAVRVAGIPGSSLEREEGVMRGCVMRGGDDRWGYDERGRCEGGGHPIHR